MSQNQQLLPPIDYIPADIRSAQDYEYLARRFVAGASYEYIAGGSGRDQTLASNLAAFKKWTLCPRVLCDVSQGSTTLKFLNRRFPHPIFLAPVAYQRLAHPLGELGSARGADAMQSCMVVSTLATQSLEAIAETGTQEKWFQLYIQSTPEATLELVKRAEAAGYKAIVVTVDTPIRMPSLGALRAGFSMPDDCVAVNVAHDLVDPLKKVDKNESRIFKGVMQAAPTWADLAWLIDKTNIPVIVKGVLHPVDALKIKNMGAAGLIVSNHGGRSLDGAPASLDCLAAVRAAVGADYPILLDSGIRSGLDIFIAIALGADAVLIGRLQVYALSVAGALGVAHMLKLLREELELCMALMGCATLNDIRNTKLELKQS